MELVDKAAIVAEIEKRIEECNKWADAAAEKNLHNTLEANELVIGQYESLLSFLDILKTKDVNLEKACKWLEEHSWDYLIGDNFKDEKMISDFRKAMEE